MHSTSIVIPLGRGSVWKDNELRYCLRSMEKHLSGMGDVFIIGELPAWIQNVTYIPANDDKDIQFKERNIYEKILLACEDERVSEDFFFANDDHIILSDYDISQFPTYKKEDLYVYVERNKENEQYRRTLVQTITYLLPKSYGVDNFDCHCPIIYNKEKFKTLSQVDWNEPCGYAIKSLYGNLNKIEGVYNEDVKCGSMGQDTDWLRARMRGKKFMSLMPYVNYDMRMLLEELFPTPSRFEKVMRNVVEEEKKIPQEPDWFKKNKNTYEND